MSHESPFQFEIVDTVGLLPVALEGREACSEPFGFSVVMRAGADDARTFQSHLDRDATLSFASSSGAQRTLTGVVRRVELLERTARGEVVVRYGFGPRFSRLGERHWSRIHANLSVPDAISRVLREHNVPHRFELSGSYPAREYQVQYQETDRAFVERIAAEVGLFFYFTGAVEGDGTVLVFADGNTRLRAVDGPSELHVHVFEGGATERPALREEQIAAFQLQRAAAPKSLVGFDYDFTRPLHSLREQAELAHASKAPALGTGVNEFVVPLDAVYEHRSDTERPELTGTRAAAALDQWQEKSGEARAVAGSRLLGPGYRFTLARHPIDGVAGGYVITSLTHRAFAEEAEGRVAYQAELTCVPEALVPRPARPQRRLVQVTESAVVVGPQGHEIHTDEHGRVRIRFHWDTRGAVELASCFVRVVQPWAGEGWGFQFIPRIGMEVLVTFLQGDPDVPIVVGSLANATHPPPFALPESQTRSGIRTRSTRDAHGATAFEGGAQGFNEVSFEDTAGREQVFVRAQKDLVVQALYDSHTQVGHDATTIVSANRVDETQGTTTIRAVGEATYWYASDAIAHHEKDAETNVGGDLRTNVGGSSFANVAGTSTTKVDSDRIERVGANISVRAGRGYVLQVGESSMQDPAPPPGEITLHSTGTLSASADKRTIISADESLTLICGESRIELTPREIRLVAPHVVAVGTESFVAAGKGPSIELQEHAKILTQELQILTKSGSLELGDSTILKGKSIKLEQPNSGPAGDRSEDPPDTKRVRVQLTDDRYRPYANCRFHGRCEAIRLEGSTDGEGFVELVVPKKAKRATLTFWTGPYPTGARTERTLILGELPEIDTLAGVQVRLRNLGYYLGSTAGEILDEATRAALRHFQHDNGLPLNGDPDAPTKRAIVARHRH